MDYQNPLVYKYTVTSENVHFVEDEVVTNVCCSTSGDLAIPILWENRSDEKVKINGKMNERIIIGSPDNEPPVDFTTDCSFNTDANNNTDSLGLYN